jgi:hypothetical protein
MQKQCVTFSVESGGGLGFFALGEGNKSYPGIAVMSFEIGDDGDVGFRRCSLRRRYSA